MRLVPEYLKRCFLPIELICGGIIAVVYFFFADAGGLGGHRTLITAGIIEVALLTAGYHVFREERLLRTEREKAVRVTARLGSLAANMPDPGPGKVSLRVGVNWEVWVNQDVSTDKLALNLIYLYDRPWWQFWKKVRFPMKGLAPKGKDSTQYRKSFRTIDPQPIKDSAVFEYITDREGSKDPHWLLELILITGIPAGEHRIPVFIDYDEIESRGKSLPL